MPRFYQHDPVSKKAPRPRWEWLVCTLGLTMGLGLYTFHYAKGTSYFFSDPKACANCHAMQSYYDSWGKSSHHHAARCVDCHLPHDLASKYIAKGVNGYHHSKAFTLQDYPDKIMIHERNSRILEDSCLHCHGDITAQMTAFHGSTTDKASSCVRCHSMVGHGAPYGN